MMRMIASAAVLPLLTLHAFGAPKYPVFGVNFSPFMDGQDGASGIVLDEEQVVSRLKRIKGQSEWIRTYSTELGMENAGEVAHRLGFKTALGAWLQYEPWRYYSDYYHRINEQAVTNLIAAANRGGADMVIVGSEVLHRGDLTSTQLVAYIEQVRASIPQNIPVTTADAYDVLLRNPDVMDACDVVVANFYPYWKGARIDTAISTIEEDYLTLVQAAGQKEVWVGETGWPSGGNSVGGAVPNKRNAAYYFLAFESWVRANGVKSFYFEAYDEAWKERDEGPQGAHWGIRTSKGKLKAYRNLVYRGYMLPPEGYLRSIPSSYLPGKPSVQLTRVPAYGSYDGIWGLVCGVPTSEYVVATYIYAYSGWWSKPTWANPTVSIDADGTFYVNTVTGGVDHTATSFLVFVIPKTYSPPLASGGSVPSAVYSNAVAYTRFQRPSGFTGFATNVPQPVIERLAIKRVFGTSPKAGDTLVLTGTLPVANTPIFGSDVTITVAGVNWQFEPMTEKGKAGVLDAEGIGQTGKISAASVRDGWKFSAVMGCLPGNTNWIEYGFLDETLKAPGIPVFVPITVVVNGTNSYWRTVSSYYTARAGRTGRMSGSSKTPSN
jgi:exo-beta-1,3-glucanase (GH17 family)